MKFKKGDMVYYYSKKYGTIPAVIKAIGKTPVKKRSGVFSFIDSVFIRGEAPTTGGFISSWVHISNVELQSENP